MSQNVRPTRRAVLKIGGVGLGTLVLAACTPKTPNSKHTPTDAMGSENLGTYLNNPKFHQAVKLSIDMVAVNKGLMHGLAKPADTLISPGAYKPTSGLEKWAYNPTKAKQLLKEIGWKPGTELDLVYYYSDQGTVDFMSTMQQYLDKVGIAVSPRLLTGDLASQLWTKPKDPVAGPSAVKWDIAYAAVAALSPLTYYTKYLSTYASNSYYPKNKQFEPLIEAVQNAPSRAEYTAAFHKMVKWANKQLPSVPLYYQPLYVIQSDRLNRAGAPYGNEQFNYDWKIKDWTIKPDSAGHTVMYTNGGAVSFFEHPFFNPGTFMSTRVLWDHVLVASPDLSTFSPQLAKDIHQSADGKTVTFTLRDNLFWHDGKPLTPADVKFTFELAAQVGTLEAEFTNTINSLAGSQSFLSKASDHISGIAINGQTVTLHFDKIDPDVMLTLSQLPPMPQHLLGNADPLKFQQDAYFQAPVGSGPFKISKVSMGNYSLFEPFDKYWGGRPKIDQINMYPSGESDPNFVKNALAGKVDYGYDKSVDDAAALKNVKSLSVHPVNVMYTRELYINGFPRQ